jgi:hypothetical protein
LASLQEIIEYFRGEGKVITKAPVAFVVALLLLGWLICEFLESRYVHQLEDAHATIDRYRRALEVEKNTGTTTLIELTNTELKQKGTILYKKIQDLDSFHNKNIRELKAQHERKEIDKLQLKQLWDKQEAQVAEEFAKELRTDALMVREELRNRIPEERRKHIIGLPNVNPADSREGSVSLYSVLPTPLNFHVSGQLAYEIEELVKLLPDK